MIWTLIIILNFGSVNEIRKEISDAMSFEACIKRGTSNGGATGILRAFSACRGTGYR